MPYGQKSGKPTQPARTARGRATRAHIVTTAADLFFSRGVAGTSVEDVQMAASVSASQIYHYFGDKNGLVRAVVAHRAASAPDPTDQPTGLDSIERLEAWCEHAIAGQIARRFVGGCELGSLSSELAETGDDVRQELAAAFARWESPLRQGLRSMHAYGQLLPHADPDALATALLAALQGGILLTQVRRDAMPLRVTLDAVMNHIRSQLQSPPRAEAPPTAGQA